LFKITFLTIKENSDLLFHTVTLNFQAFVTTYQPSAQNYGLCKWNLWESFAFPHHFGICDPHMLLQRAKKMKSHFLPRHHTVRQVAALLQQSGRECLEHPPYSLDFAPADFIAMINTNVSSITKVY
jgi:hypothetical protein